MLQQYKTHIWELIECHAGAFFHVVSSLLLKIAQVQESFLHKLDLSNRDAFLKFNFAPTILRRNIGVLGFLHKRVLGLSHPSIEKLLPWYAQRFDEPRNLGHNKQLYGHSVEISHQRSLFNRSIFAMVDIYNNLPQEIVDASSVKIFQSLLTKVAKERCLRGDPDWTMSFCRREGPDLDGPPVA